MSDSLYITKCDEHSWHDEEGRESPPLFRKLTACAALPNGLHLAVTLKEAEDDVRVTGAGINLTLDEAQRLVEHVRAILAVQGEKDEA